MTSEIEYLPYGVISLAAYKAVTLYTRRGRNFQNFVCRVMFSRLFVR